jgi:hypothetical protein
MIITRLLRYIAVLSGAAVFFGGVVEGRISKATVVIYLLALQLRSLPRLALGRSAQGSDFKSYKYK